MLEVHKAANEANFLEDLLLSITQNKHKTKLGKNYFTKERKLFCPAKKGMYKKNSGCVNSLKLPGTFKCAQFTYRD